MFPIKHGLSKVRLNEAKGYAHLIAENVAKIDHLWHLSENSVIDEEAAQNLIDAYRQDIEDCMKGLENRIAHKEPHPGRRP